MKNNLNHHKTCLLAAILAGFAILLSCGCSSLSNDANVVENNSLSTNKIKIYFLPDYVHLKNDSLEWKGYEGLAGESIRFLREEKGYIATSAGYIGKEAAGKSNALTSVFSGVGVNLQEKTAVGFVNKEFPQGSKEDSLILCIYAQPQYPCKKGEVVYPYPEPGAALVYAMGVSRVELGYVLIDPVRQAVIKRRKDIFSRKLRREPGGSAFGTYWKFIEEQNDFFEKSVGKLFEGFPGRRRAARAVDEPFVPELSSTTPISNANAVSAGDTYSKLARQRVDKKDYQITIESIDGTQWLVTIDLKGSSAEKIERNLTGGKSEGDWVSSVAKDGSFHGQVGKADLEQILKTFLNWRDDPDKAQH